MTGAAVLVARGALAAGAGLVQVATEAPEQVTAAVPEAITVALDLADPDATVPRLCELAERADAVVLGPGLGLREGTQRVVRQLVARLHRPLVLDADGLNAFRHDGDALREHAAPLLALTPHRAEARPPPRRRRGRRRRAPQRPRTRARQGLGRGAGQQGPRHADRRARRPGLGQPDRLCGARDRRQRRRALRDAPRRPPGRPPRPRPRSRRRSGSTGARAKSPAPVTARAAPPPATSPTPCPPP